MLVVLACTDRPSQSRLRRAFSFRPCRHL